MYRDERNKISDEKMPITRERIFGGTGEQNPPSPMPHHRQATIATPSGPFKVSSLKKIDL
jgi:hypothetical protein